MAITSADFNISVLPNPMGSVVGMNGNLNIYLSNTNLVDRGYNLSIELTLPDGVSYVNSEIEPTSINIGPSNTIVILWTNIKDLAPNELDYEVGITLKADETFRETGYEVPFDVPLSSVIVKASVDTMPRGDDDPSNVNIEKQENINFIPLRYDLGKVTPEKIPKGAGLLSPPTVTSWEYIYTIIVKNNSRLPSDVTFIDNLPNGVRYLGDLNVSGPDAIELGSPTVTIPISGGQDFVTIDWGMVTLSSNSVNTITFKAAIWDNYTVGGIENSGGRIPHLTPLQNIVNIDGISGPVQRQSITNAMDAVINKSVTTEITDVNTINHYTLTYGINQYDNIDNFDITDIISNGQSYNADASTVPDTITFNLDGTTTLIWNLGTLVTDTTGTITFSTTTDTDYTPSGSVNAGDYLDNSVDIDGTNATTSTATPDSSRVNIYIKTPNITKELLGYYYKDGTVKTYNVAAPGDEVEFRITYSSSGITAQQKDIEIDEYAPSNMGPLTSGLPVSYSGTWTGTFVPYTVTPNGLRWDLGNVSGNNTWIATFKIPVSSEFVGTKSNLGKLAGENISGLGYSDRDQVEVKFGEPNIEFEKIATGPDINAIKIGETYTYSITVSNPQNLEGTVVDAFEIDLTDTIPIGLTYTGNSNVTGTGTYDAPIFTGQNVTWTIEKLAPNESLTLNFDVIVDSTIVSGETFTNNAILQRPYSQPDRSYQYIGSPFQAQITLKAEAIRLQKLITPSFAKIGDKVTYIIQATVPRGTSAYNIKLVDNFSSNRQQYLNNAKIDGLPVTPSVSWGTVTFPTIPYIDATSTEVLITYSFDIRITNATHTSPYIENQINRATINWEDEYGTVAVPIETSEILEARTPYIRGIKEQRNVTQGGVFRTRTLNYDVGDTIEYSLSMTNEGTATAYNTVITDTINALLSFITGSITVTHGMAVETGGIITWNILELLPGEIATLKFSILTLPGAATGGRIPNRASYKYNTNNNSYGREYGIYNTNIIYLRTNYIYIRKTAVPTRGEIGDDITYTITIRVPNGTIAYTPLVKDTLPIGQTYIGPSTRNGSLITPTIVGQEVIFPINPNIDATAGEVTIVYVFIARITSADHVAPFEEKQRNKSSVDWAIEPGGSFERRRTSRRTITVRMPNIEILKEQENHTTGGGYTTDDITGVPDNQIYYKLTITSNGESPAYNINLTDILDSTITYVGIVVPPTVGSISELGGTVTWTIPQLDDGDIATVEFEISINDYIGAGKRIPDKVNVTYDSNDVNPIQYTLQSNEVALYVPKPELEKIADKLYAAIGEIITYTITVTILDKLSAHNIQMRDLIPAGQQYIPGTWSPGTVTEVGNELIYIDTTVTHNGPATLTYTFQTEVISGITTSPYIETQTNTIGLSWQITPIGPYIHPVTDYCDVEIRSPHIQSLKEQRDVTGGGTFTTGPISGIGVGDTVEYRITLTNDGENTAYHATMTDVLDLHLSYGAVVSVNPPLLPNPTESGGTVTWTGFNLNAGDSATLVFSVTVTGTAPAGETITNQTSTEYDTSSVAGIITLGPVFSNEVGFDYTLPEIIKTVDKDSVFVGDIVTYTVAITIPVGNIAYDVQVSDILPTEQTYIPESMTRNGVSIPSATLDFPYEGNIDATTGAVTITYTFEAEISSISIRPEDEQEDIAIINWNKLSGSDPGTPQYAYETVYVTDNDIGLSKKQKNFTTGGYPVPYTTDRIQVSVGDIIAYEYLVTNPSTTETLYDVKISDELENSLRYRGHPIPPTIGVIYHTGELSDGTVTWCMGDIPPNTTERAVIIVEVLAGKGAQSTIEDNITSTFSVTSGSTHIYGPKTSNTVEAQLPSLQIEKNVSTDEAEVGEIIEYTLTITVPNGTKAYDIVVSDTLPNEQVYAGEATREGIIVFPSVVGQVITFDAENIIDATAGAITVEYTVKARVVSGNDSSPYTEIQTDTTEVNWKVDIEGTEATPTSDMQDVTVNSAKIMIAKQQGNITKGTCCLTEEMAVDVGDIVGFRLIVHNFGKSPAYNVVVVDELSDFLEYMEVINVTAGTVTFDPVNNRVIWNIDEIPGVAEDALISATVERLEFKLKVLGGKAAQSTGSNDAVVYYDTNIQTPIEVGPIISNEVVHRYPNIRVEKTADITHTVVGDIITYTLRYTLPKGTVVYDGQVKDILPIGQEYHNNATLNGTPIVPCEIDGQLIKFDLFSCVTIFDEDKTAEYKFEALIVSADIDPITLIDIQMNETQGSWYLDAAKTIKSEPIEDTLEVDVTSSNMTVNKMQRGISEGGNFTTNQIEVKLGEVVEYKLIVVNTGVNTIYEIVIEDVLSDELEYIGPINVPVGTITNIGQKVIWTIPSLDEGEQVESIFSIKLVNSALDTIENEVVGKFKVNPESPVYYGDIESNTVIIKQLLKMECIITDRVFSSCQNRVCFTDIKVDVPIGYKLKSVKFSNGEIIPNSLIVTPIESRPNYSRVLFEAKIKYEAILENNMGTIKETGTLPTYIVDIVMFMPNHRDEEVYKIKLDTKSKTIYLDEDKGIFISGTVNLIMGTFKVKILIPVFGYCDEPSECEEWIDVCNDFLSDG